MMPEYTTLTEYLEALESEREALENVDVEAKVEEKISEIRAKVRAEVVKEIEHSKLVADIKISAVTDAIDIVTRAHETEEVDEDEVPEVISDETF